jgi:sensor histidine kinase YesM
MNIPKQPYYDRVWTYARREQRFWVRAFVVYVFLEILLSLFSYLSYQKDCGDCEQSLLSFLSHGILEILFTAALWFVLRWFHKRKGTGTIVVNIIVFAIYYLLWIAVKYVGVRLQIISIPDYGGKDNVFEDLIYSSWFAIGKYVLKLSAFYVLRFYVAYRESEQKRTELAVINKDMQLNLLKQQLSPHFYFNTLNNLYGLSRINSGKLSSALSQLSNIMHYVLHDCTKSKVLLSQEISFLQSYIALEKLRYEEDTIIEMQITGSVNGQTILPLLLIQFVENGFKHGMKEKLEENWMKVKMEIREESLVFAVDNSYYSSTPVKGIGLTNLKHRLDLQYADKYDMTMHHQNNQFSLRLELNLS